jgi:hypothetical protein
MIDKNDKPEFEAMFENLSRDLFPKNIREVPRVRIMACLTKRKGEMKIETNKETHVLTKDFMMEL